MAQEIREREIGQAERCLAGNLLGKVLWIIKEIKWLIEVFIQWRIKDDSKKGALQATTFHVHVRE